MIIVNSLLSIHNLCSEHHLLIVTVTREITTTQWWSPHQYEYKKGKIKCIDLHYYVVVNITTIHFHYQVLMIIGSNVHFNSRDVHYSVFTVYNAVADPVGFDEVRSNPPFLVRWRPFTISLAVLFSPG